MRSSSLLGLLLALLTACGDKPAAKLNGSIAHLVEDTFDPARGSKTTSYFVADGNRIPLELPEGESYESLPTGTPIEAEGEVKEGKLKARSVRATAAPRAEAPRSTSQRILIVLMNFADNRDTGVSAASLNQQAFTNGLSTASLYNAMSYGNLTFTGDVVGYFTTSQTSKACNWTAWISDIEPQLTAAGINWQSYDHVAYAFRGNTTCGWTGIGWIGGGKAWGQVAIGVQDYVVPLFYHVLAHEIGHNLGLPHAHSQNPYSDVGDNYDLMGYEETMPKQFSGPEKAYLGWLLGASIVTASGSSTYTLNPIETNNGAVLLAVPRSDGQFYYVEYRAPGSFDNVPSSYANGVQVHIGPALGSYNSGGQLVNVGGQVAEGTGQWDTLSPGATFSDGSIRITTLAAGNGSAKVYVSLTNTPYSAPPAPAPTPSPAPPAGTPSYAFVSKTSGKCLDDPGAGNAPGTILQQYDCNGTPAQRFELVGVNGATNPVQLLNMASKLCVGLNGGGGNGTGLIQVACSGSDPSQQWSWSQNGDGTFTFKNVSANRCLDDTNTSQANGTQMQAWDCVGNTNQSFSAEKES